MTHEGLSSDGVMCMTDSPQREDSEMYHNKKWDRVTDTYLHRLHLPPGSCTQLHSCQVLIAGDCHMAQLDCLCSLGHAELHIQQIQQQSCMRHERNETCP